MTEQAYYKLMESESRAALAQQDRECVCNGCGETWESDEKPGDCPACGYQDTERVTDRMECIAEQFAD